VRSSLLRPPGEKAEKGHFRSDKSNKSGEHDLSIIKRTIDRWRVGFPAAGTACLLRSFDRRQAS
jgi:hypothetical protein